MTTEQLLLVIVTAAITLVFTLLGQRLLDYMRGKDTAASLKRDNKTLSDENEALRGRVRELEEKESERLTKEQHQKDHGRDDRQVNLLRMLNTQHGRTVKAIAKQLGIGPELALTQLVQLSHDNFVHSANYTDDPHCDDGCEPYDSTWYIQQPGRTYLANNGLLT